MTSAPEALSPGRGRGGIWIFVERGSSARIIHIFMLWGEILVSDQRYLFRPKTALPANMFQADLHIALQ